MPLSKIVANSITDNTITTDQIADTSVHGRRNLVINGAMQVAQRGQTFTSISLNTYTCDRWFYQLSGSGGRGTATQETSGGPAGFKDNFLRVTVTNTDSTVAADDIILVKQVLEGHVAAFTDQGTADAQDLTLSFYVRSSITGTFSATLLTNFSPTPASHPKNYTINSANTWERKTITFPGYTTSKTLVSSGYTNGEYMQVRFALLAGSNRTGPADQWNLANDFATTSQINFFANSGATWDITGVQLELGSQASPFEHRSLGEELTLCQRYFAKASGEDNNSRCLGHGSRKDGNGTGFRVITWVPVAMRADPSVVEKSPGSQTYRFNGSNGNYNNNGSTAATLDNNGQPKLTLNVLGFSGIPENAQGLIKVEGSGNWVALDAEL